MGTLPQHNLSGLLEDDCWSLFKERAFGLDREERPNLVALGKEIVKKCGGVPLAVKSLGALMRFKDRENEWLHVRDSELWNLPPRTQVLYIDNDIQGGGLTGRFPSLKELKINYLPRLLRLSIEDGKELFPCLTKLEIRNCHKLTLPCLPSLEYLRVTGCSDAMLRSISDARQLNYLYFCDNDESIFLPQGMPQNLTSVHSITIEDFSKLKGLPTELQQLSNLRSLKLIGCPELVAFPEGIKHLSSLQHLTISGRYPYKGILSNLTVEKFECWAATPSQAKLAVLPEVLRHIPALQSLSISSYPDLASLPSWLGDLTSLQSLYISNCPNLSSLPVSIQSLSNLLELDIYDCPELVKRCEKETGEDWYKITHIPEISVM